MPYTREQAQRYRETHRAELRAREKVRTDKLKASDPDFYKSKHARQMASNPAAGKLNTRRHRGLPAPLRTEPECCEICGVKPAGRWKALCLDHDHITGKFRGWLCHRCNRGIGLLGDSLESLTRVVRYLQNAELL